MTQSGEREHVAGGPPDSVDTRQKACIKGSSPTRAALRKRRRDSSLAPPSPSAAPRIIRLRITRQGVNVHVGREERTAVELWKGIAIYGGSQELRRARASAPNVQNQRAANKCDFVECSGINTRHSRKRRQKMPTAWLYAAASTLYAAIIGIAIVYTPKMRTCTRGRLNFPNKGVWTTDNATETPLPRIRRRPWPPHQRCSCVDVATIRIAKKA